MKPFRYILIVLVACLIANTACTVDTNSQTKEKSETNKNPQAKGDSQALAYFNAGIVALEANNMPLAYNEFLAAAKVGGIQANNTYPADFIYSNLMIQNNVIHQSKEAGVERSG